MLHEPLMSHKYLSAPHSSSNSSSGFPRSEGIQSLVDFE